MPRVIMDAVGIDLKTNGTVIATDMGMVIAVALRAVVKRTGIESVVEIDGMGTVVTVLFLN